MCYKCKSVNIVHNRIIDSSDVNTNNIQILRQYIHHIRNAHTLDDNMIQNIRNMSDDEKMYIIVSLNEIVDYLKYVSNLT
jgi:hypothetical protein